MSTAVTPQPQPVAPPAPQPVVREVRVYSHSPIFYWWPVWAVGYLIAAAAQSYLLFVLAQAVLIGMLGSSASFGPLVADVCRRLTPVLEEKAPAHFAACHLRP